MEFADAIAWLASPENKDEEIRKQAKEVLDKLFFLTERFHEKVDGKKSKKSV